MVKDHWEKALAASKATGVLASNCMPAFSTKMSISSNDTPLPNRLTGMSMVLAKEASESAHKRKRSRPVQDKRERIRSFMYTHKWCTKPDRSYATLSLDNSLTECRLLLHTSLAFVGRLEILSGFFLCPLGVVLGTDGEIVFIDGALSLAGDVEDLA